jgi:hypothetical protein
VSSVWVNDVAVLELGELSDDDVTPGDEDSVPVVLGVEKLGDEVTGDELLPV